jgi:hypothetical protein
MTITMMASAPVAWQKDGGDVRLLVDLGFQLAFQVGEAPLGVGS